MEIIRAKDDAFNRKILEHKRNIILLSPETGTERSDKLKQLDSGLNHVLARIATKNNNSIGIDLREIRSRNKKEKAKQLARIRQNIKICRKEKTKIICLNQEDKRNALSLLTTLGASTQQAVHFKEEQSL